MRTEGQKGCHLSPTQRHLWPNRPLSVFLIYLIRLPVDIALSSFLCVCKLVGFNRFFFFSSQDTDKLTPWRQARNASTADSRSDCCSKKWWPQLFVRTCKVKLAFRWTSPSKRNNSFPFYGARSREKFERKAFWKIKVLSPMCWVTYLRGDLKKQKDKKFCLAWGSYSQVWRWKQKSGQRVFFTTGFCLEAKVFPFSISTTLLNK